MRKPYFPTDPNAPAPLKCTTSCHVRFEEVDSMGIVWHGRYPGYFEEARIAIGHQYGISYCDFINNRIPVPIRQITIDYHEPLFFEDKIDIEAIMHWSEAARINIEYNIYKQNKVVCTGSTIQLMLDDQFNLLLEPPEFYKAFMAKWKAGKLT